MSWTVSNVSTRKGRARPKIICPELRWFIPNHSDLYHWIYLRIDWSAITRNRGRHLHGHRSLSFYVHRSCAFGLRGRNGGRSHLGTTSVLALRLSQG